MIRCTLAELETLLVPLLKEICDSDLKRRPFIIVEEPLTGSFVQYARWVKPGVPGRTPGELCFDVPAFGVVLVRCESPKEAAALGFATLRARFELPVDAELEIKVDGDPAN